MLHSMNLSNAFTHRLRRPGLAALALALAATPSLRAFVFEVGEIKGSFDTTLSVGGLYRLQDPDKQYYGLTAGGLKG